MNTDKKTQADKLFEERRAQIEEGRGRATSRALQEYEAAARRLRRSTDRFDREELALERHREGAVVLVRSSAGSPLSVYHSADHPCGRARYRGFDRLFEGEVKDAHPQLNRCRSCLWPRGMEPTLPQAS